MGKEENKKRYEYLKSRGICVACGKNRAFQNRVRCSDCLYKVNESSLKYRRRNIEEVLKKDRERKKQRNRERRERGMCSCGREAIKGKTYCVECRIKAKRRYEERNKNTVKREDFKYLNLCRICGAKELVENRKLCPRCYENALKGLKVASKRNLQNHIWKKGF